MTTRGIGFGAALTLCLAGACGSDGGHGGGGSGGVPECTEPCLDLQLEAADALVATTAALRADVAAACAAIATDLGATGVVDVSDPASLSDAELEAVCILAAAQIQQAMGGEAYLISVGIGYCGVGAEAQLACEQGPAPGGCDPGTLESRCPPGSLVGTCEGACSGTCTAASAACAGICAGICEGSCAGQCHASGPSGCNGYCDGECDGICHGSCTASAGAEVECLGICEGGCSGTLTDPICRYELTPVPCEVKSDCALACAVLGPIHTTCIAPGVALAASPGPGDPALVATAQENLPALLSARERVDLALVAASALLDFGLLLGTGEVDEACGPLLGQIAEKVASVLPTLEVLLTGTIVVDNALTG